MHQKYDYMTSPEFIADKTAYEELAQTIKELSNVSKENLLPATKIEVLGQLIEAISKFDSHLRGMIERFPDYYPDCREQLDNILAANSSYLLAAYSEIERTKAKMN